MAVVTVFVDDAVCGRFPPVCAKTGQPSDGSLSLSHDVRGASSVSTAWLLLLLLLGPIGWLMLLVLALANPRQTEWLTVQLPWSTEAMERLRAARAQRRNLWIGAAASLVGSAAALVAWTGAGTALDLRLPAGGAGPRGRDGGVRDRGAGGRGARRSGHRRPWSSTPRAGG